MPPHFALHWSDSGLLAHQWLQLPLPVTAAVVTVTSPRQGVASL